MTAIAGVFPVLATPFDADGAIDTAGFNNLIDFVIDNGVDGFVFPGLASEYDMLSLVEREGLVARIGAANQGRAHFIVGAGGADAAESAAMVRAGVAAGAVGAMVMTPSRLTGDIEGLVAFYRDVGEIGLPIMLQNAPAPMGIGLSPADVLAVVAAVPAIRWIKEENMPCGQRISTLLAGAPDHLLGVFGGAGGRYITDELARGALGTMPAAELPSAHVALMAAYRAGDEAAVRDEYEAMLPMLMMQAVFRWRLTKDVLRRRGIISSAHTRAAGPAFDEGDHLELDRIMARIDARAGAAV